MARRVPHNLTNRLLLAYGAVVSLVILAVILVGSWYFRRTADNEINRLASTTSSVIAHSLERVSFSGKYHTRLLLQELAARNGDILYLAVLDGDGRVFAHSDPALDDTVDRSRPALRALEVLSGGGPIFQDLVVAGRPVREVDVPLVGGYGRSQLGVVRVGLCLDNLTGTRQSGLVYLLLFSLGLAVVSLVLLTRISAYFARPMHEMAHTLQGIMDHTPQVVLIRDREGRVNLVNKRFAEVFGRLPEQRPRPDSYPVLPPEERKQVQVLDDEVFATGASVQREMRLTTGTEQRDFQVVKFPVAHDQRGAVALVCTFLLDVSETRALEEQLRQSQKMEAMGHLAGGVAHDFNNLLMGIMGHADLVRMGVEGNAELVEDVDSLLSAAKRAADLTGKLLTFSRRRAINAVPLDLNEAVQRMQTLLARVIGEDIQLEFRPDPGAPHVLADSVHLDQIILNLVTNARDAMPAGGQLTITTGTATEQEQEIREGLVVAPGRYGVIQVVDTGIGMDEATQQKIFEPFFTTKETGKGTGLGLSTVFGIVKQHQGSIEVDSRPGRGTTFRVLLPAAAAGAGPAAAVEPETAAASRSGGTVLVVEDDTLLRSYLTRLLEREGYGVLCAADGAEGVARFREHRERIDICLLDVIMPEMNGLEVRERIQEIDPGVPVVLMSGYTADILSRHGSLDLGCEFLTKPVTRATLLETLARAMGRT